MRISIRGKWSNDSRFLIENRGFTLLELSLVILVIGVILALILPNLGTPKAKLEKQREIENISQLIKYLYNLSQLQNKEILLIFDLDGNRFWAIYLTENEDSEVKKKFVDEEFTDEYLVPKTEKNLSNSLMIKDIIDDEGNKVTQGLVPVFFAPLGFVEPITLHIADEENNFYTLRVNPLTGQTSIEKGYLEEE